MPTSPVTPEILLKLREAVAACGGRAEVGGPAAVSTGCPDLDRLLPFGGVLRGSLTEWLSDRAGGGAESLALALTREACRDGGAIVLLDRDRQFYPPAAAACGIALDRMIVVHSETDADELWAADQSLRSRAVAAVWLWRERIRPHDYRRLRLAAEEGNTIGVLLRSRSARGEATWADLQLEVRPRPGVNGRRLSVEVTRCRGGPGRSAIEVEVDHITGVVRGLGRHVSRRVSTLARLAGPAGGFGTTGTARPGGAVARPRPAAG